MTLLWAELSSVRAEATSCISPPCETVAADALSPHAEPIMRAAKQVAGERIAAGSFVLLAERSPEALDTRCAGEALTAPCEADATAPPVMVTTTSVGL